jgi:hypothetical protein
MKHFLIGVKSEAFARGFFTAAPNPPTSTAKRAPILLASPVQNGPYRTAFTAAFTASRHRQHRSVINCRAQNLTTPLSPVSNPLPPNQYQIA